MTSPKHDSREVLERALRELQHLRGRVQELEQAAVEPIAIVGMGCRFPGGANDAESYWQLLREGRSAVREVPKDRWDIERYYDPDPEAAGHHYMREASFLDRVDGFDAAFFNISPREAASLDPQQRLLLEVGWETLENAGLAPDRLVASSTGVFVGLMNLDYPRLQGTLVEPEHIDAYTGSGSGLSFPAGRLSYCLGLQGPSMVVCTACSSSLVAVHLACQSLRQRECDMALAGGVSLMLTPDMMISVCRMGAVSPDGRSKTFAATADGYGRGEGCGLIALKRLSQAQADGDRILAVLRGSAVNHNGRSAGLTVPNGLAQEALLRSALANAQVSAEQVSFVEAHGTGTSLGDPLEIEALNAVFGKARKADQPLAVGAVKTNFGHLEAAAGIAGLLKVILALQQEEVPPHLHLNEPNPHIPWQKMPLRIPTEVEPWPRNEQPRMAGVSSFGLSGVNAHVVVEEAPSPEATLAAAVAGPHVLCISAQDQEALGDLVGRYRDLAAADEGPSLEDLAWTAATRRSHHAHRLSLVADSRQEVEQALAAHLAGDSSPGLAHGRITAGVAPRWVWVFSGQGSQWPGMGLGLLEREAVFRQKLEECDELISRHGEISLLEALRAPAEAEQLSATRVMQPAIFALQVSLAALWRSWGLRPHAVVGQSLGEVAAAHVAGALSLEDAVRVVCHRSRLMESLAGKGRTAVVELPHEQAEIVLIGFEDAISVAGSLSPTSSVLSGDAVALPRMLQSLERRSIFCRQVEGVDIALHSPHMEALIEPLEKALSGLTPQNVGLPLYSTVTGERIAGSELDAGYWGRNLRQPFLLAPVIESLLAEQYSTFLEVSPHPVLGAPLRQTLAHHRSEGRVVSSLARGEDERRSLLSAASQLYVAGAMPHWHKLMTPAGHADLPSYPWQRQRYWFDQIRQGSRAVSGRRAAGRHPLLGMPVQSATRPGESLWELDLDLRSLPFLRDHQVLGEVILPAAAGLEMAIGASGRVFNGESCELSDATFAAPLVLGSGAQRLQLVVDRDGDSAHFTLASRPADEDTAEQEWAFHTSGVLRRYEGADPPSVESIEAARERCSTEIEVEEHYRLMEQRGLEYGPAFRAVASLQSGPGEAVARLQLSSAQSHAAGSYRMHPILLDAGFQIVGAAMGEAVEASASFLPAGLDQLRFYAPECGAELWCHARLRDESAAEAGAVEADLSFLNPSGELVARASGLRLQRVGGRAEVAAEIYRHVWELDERQAENDESAQVASPGAFETSRWVVLCDESGVGEALAARIRSGGGDALTVATGDAFAFDPTADRATLGPKRRADLERLLAAMPEDWELTGVILLWGLDVGGAMDSPNAMESWQCELALTVGSLVSSAGLGEPPLWLVSSGVREASAADAVAQAATWGLGRVLALEHPERRAAVLDLAAELTPDQAVERIASELSRSDAEDHISLSASQRWVGRLERAADVVGDPATVVQPYASYLVTGGFGGLGQVVAQWLAEQGARQIILLGRNGLPPRDEWSRHTDEGSIGQRVAAVRQLEKTGASVEVVAADVSDEAALEELFDRWQRELRPPIRGVVHAAGVLSDAYLARLDESAVRTVLRPKVAGAWVLHRLLEKSSLDFFVLFSSISSILGAAGQAAYAAANASLDALARFRCAHGLPATSVNWGPWSEVGMAAPEVDRFAELGIGAIPPPRGAELFGELTAASVGSAVVLAADWRRVAAAFRTTPPPLITKLTGGASAPAATARVVSERGRSGRELRSALEQADPEQWRDLIEPHMGRLVAGVLGLDPEQLDNLEPLTALGMDSIMAVELQSLVESMFGVNLSMASLFQGSSVAQMTALTVEELQANGLQRWSKNPRSLQ
ncbi:MAG: type I polyketide synthase [Acidobacteriota bacterium]